VAQTQLDKLIHLGYQMIKFSSEKFISNRVLSHSIKIINQGCKFEKAVKYVSEIAKDILENNIIRLIMLSKKDIDEFECNPIEHIRKQSDITVSFYSSKCSA